jgi:hypothetical protein
MKIIVLLIVVLAVIVRSSDACPKAIETACVNEVNKGSDRLNIAYKACDEAAKEQGKDTPADLDCLKYFSGLKKDCWPCICQIAAAESWKIKGCTTQY